MMEITIKDFERAGGILKFREEHREYLNWDCVQDNDYYIALDHYISSLILKKLRNESAPYKFDCFSYDINHFKECEGWDGFSKRCMCGKMKVEWINGYNAGGEDIIYAHAYAYYPEL